MFDSIVCNFVFEHVARPFQAITVIVSMLRPPNQTCNGALRSRRTRADAPAWSSRAGSSPPTIATVLEKLQSALQKSRIDRATTRPTAEGWS